MSNVTSVEMGVQDALWLTMDRPNNLMVVDGAMVLGQQVDLDQVRAVYEHALGRFPVFHRKAVPAGMGWVWQDDPHFSIDRHLSEAVLPQPADMRALQRFLADQRTAPLPKDRPLWRAYLIEEMNLADGTVGSAIVNRFHHAIADGVRLTQVMLGLCELDESAKPVTVVKDHPDQGALGLVTGLAGTARSTAGAATRYLGKAGAEAASDLAHAVTHPVETVSTLPGKAIGAPGAVLHGVEDGVELLRHPDHLLDAMDVMGVEASRGANDVSSVTKLALTSSAKTVWTGKPGTHKAISWSEPIPLSLIKQIGRAGGATVNDVLISAVAGGLRNYLLQRDAFVPEINWMVPVNLKPFADNLPPDLGNYFAIVILPMPLDDEQPRDRLATMHHRMDRIKHSDEAVLTFGIQRVVSMSPGPVAFSLTNFFANKAVGVLTNVPGPRGEMTFAGAPVRQVVGFAPCSGDQPMTATIFSYNGEVTVGFATDAGLIPDPEALADLVVAGIDELAEAVGVE